MEQESSELEKLHILEKKIILALSALGEAGSEEITSKTGIEINAVMRALAWLASKNLVEIEEKVDEVITLLEEGRKYAEAGLPERKACEILKTKKAVSMEELSRALGGEEANIALGWLRRKGTAKIEGGNIVLTGDAQKKFNDELLLELLGKESRINASQLSGSLKEGLQMLSSRKNLIKVQEKLIKTVKLSEKGKKIAGKIEIKDELTQLTHQMLLDKSWKGSEFRKYDVLSEVSRKYPAKLHPLTRMMEEIREIFLVMGFKEIRGPLIENAFWNFDALFVPQDHPAREMQDTFYLQNPVSKEAEIASEEVIKNVKNAHEKGGKAKSKGWRYKWNRELAGVSLLRTHTTATTIRYLAGADEKAELKVFSIGRIFRKEKISFKHLPEFHQVEGIVAGKVNFSNLLGILREFYKRMGFEEIRFRPAYFPYTEPSLEIEVFFKEKNKWIELGGAGIFRPEVTLPLGVKKPVLAWGLGLERLAMLRLGIDHIAQLYRSDIGWLKSLPL